ncbi:Aldehyde/histidinol dehydrogenase [Amanita rubescens]|nr:Aldehyde/histidinol dehydrogenase [Amanita rubescens]
MAPFTPLFIDGKQVHAKHGGTFEVRNPYSGQVVGTSASAISEDGIAAVEAAGKAFPAWQQKSPAERRDIIFKVADLWQSDKYKQKVTQAIPEETAGSNSWAIFNWISPTLLLRAVSLDKFKAEFFPSALVPGAQVIAHRRAMGVIFSIAPWNAPITLAFRAVITPILAGNTVVLKSSEYSPRCHSIVIEAFQEAGLPDGVLNFVSCSRENAPTLTADIIAHPLVRKITFTGSDRVGRVIATEAAKYLKPCVLELGGKSPIVVLNDANIAEAAKAVVFGALAFSGQVCMSTERVIVQSGVAQPLLERVRALCETVKAGDPNDPSAGISALFSDASAENVLNMIREAQEQGGQVLYGDLQRQGSLVQPHIVTDVKPGMRLWQRESFGPVIAFAVANTVDEAIDLANNSEYSLSAALWTSDRFAALNLAPRIRAGYVNINGPTIHTEPDPGLMGLGGSSGYGRFDIEAFTDKCVMIVHPPGRQFPLVS